MTNKQMFDTAKTDFERRDVSVQFGCWLVIFYEFNEVVNQMQLRSAKSNVVHIGAENHNIRNYPAHGFTEQLFEFWLTF